MNRQGDEGQHFERGSDNVLQMSSEYVFETDRSTDGHWPSVSCLRGRFVALASSIFKCSFQAGEQPDHLDHRAPWTTGHQHKAVVLCCPASHYRRCRLAWGQQMDVLTHKIGFCNMNAALQTDKVRTTFPHCAGCNVSALTTSALTLGLADNLFYSGIFRVPATLQ